MNQSLELKKAEELYESGKADLSDDEPEEALVNFNKALELFTQMLGEKSEEVVKCYIAIGDALALADTPGEGITINLKKGEAFEGRGPKKDADLSGEIQNYQKAIENYQKAIEIMEKMTMKDIKLKSKSYENIAKLFLSKELYDESIQAYKKVLSLQENDTIYDILGNICRKKKSYDEAIEYYSKSIELKKSIHGEDDYLISVPLFNIGLSYKDKKMFEESKTYYLKALTIREAHANQKPDKFVECLLHLGGVYRDHADYDEAIKYFKSGISIGIQIWGPNAPKLIFWMGQLSDTYKEKGDYQEAIKIAKIVLDSKRKLHGDNHPRVAECFNSLADLYEHEKNFDKAIETLKIGIEILKNNSDDEENKDARYKMGGFMIVVPNKSNNEKPEGDIKPKNPITQMTLADSYFHLGNLYDETKTFESAIESYTKSLEIRNQVLKGKDQSIALCHMAIGSTNINRKKFEEAFKNFTNALEMLDSLSIVDPRVYFGLGEAYEGQGLIKEAKMSFEKALALNKGQPSEDSWLKECEDALKKIEHHS